MSWSCGACTFENPGTRTSCEVCNEKRPGSSSTSVSSSSSTSESTVWVCPACTLSQNSAVTRCQACETPNPSAKRPTGSAGISGAASAWTCSECTFVNARRGACDMCGAFDRSNEQGFGQDFEQDFGQDFGRGPSGAEVGNLLAGLVGGANNPLEAFKKNMLEMILPQLQSQLAQTTIPPNEGKVEVGGGVGQVAYQVGEIKCSQCTVDPKNVQLTIDPQGRFQLVASDIALELTEFKWSYDKLQNLKFSSSGTAACAVRGCSIHVLIKLGPSMNPEVEEVKAVVRELDVNIKKTKLKLLYDLLIASFKGQIKEALQQGLERATMDAIQDSTKSLS